ncbi:MAG: electron transfer flavoprotein subunit alpha/FixB family protein [Gammaproteobacteria bacterium]|nr:electron transfer flavoprotein subunit alpha/FixB family protein [Gammaproteobacteria bacterium]MDE2251231.1 electron transfer flavoprotein subunit alpha/FixB family protein [Gammaproteobacteria bacterium]
MSRVLIVADHDGAQLGAGVARCITAAGRLGGVAIHVAVLAAPAAAMAQQVAALAGVAKVLVVERAENARPLAAVLAPQVAKLAAGYDYVLGPSNTFGKDLMPRVAALLGVGQVSDLMSVEGPHTFKRPIYAGNAIITVESPVGTTLVATIRTASFAAAAVGGSAAIEAAGTDAELPTHTRFVSLSAANNDRPDLQSAPRVVSGGRALGSADNFKLIYALADRIGAAVGASRAAVDAGYVPSDMQVGQTGKIIAPALYMAIGISGAIQHLTGIKDARTIVAINKDAEAPIFEVADVGLIGDLFKVVPELTAALGG